MNRPTWDETWLAVADTVGQRSQCTRAKVGALVVSSDNRQVTPGYNGPPAGYQHGSQPCNVWCKRSSALSPTPDYSDCYTIHAEANALMQSDRTAHAGGTIYVNTHVCFSCAKLIANSGLARVVVRTDRADLHRDPVASYQFLMECGLKVELPGNEIMMTRLAAIFHQSDMQRWCAPSLVTRYLSREDRRTRNPQPQIGEQSFLADEGVAETFNGREWV